MSSRTSSGGAISVEGGGGAIGGQASVLAGNSTAGAGGSAIIRGGDSTTADGGDVTVRAGDPAAGSTGGDVIIEAGQGPGIPGRIQLNSAAGSDGQAFKYGSLTGVTGTGPFTVNFTSSFVIGVGNVQLSFQATSGPSKGLTITAASASSFTFTPDSALVASDRVWWLAFSA